jgi:hypothetical protein
MLCEDGIELKKRMDDACAAYNNALGTSRTGTTREHMDKRVSDLQQKCSYAKKEFDYHVAKCKDCIIAQTER